jgi:hypothetical protein
VCDLLTLISSLADLVALEMPSNRLSELSFFTETNSDQPYSSLQLPFTKYISFLKSPFCLYCELLIKSCLTTFLFSFWCHTQLSIVCSIYFSTCFNNVHYHHLRKFNNRLSLESRSLPKSLTFFQKFLSLFRQNAMTSATARTVQRAIMITRTKLVCIMWLIDRCWGK